MSFPRKFSGRIGNNMMLFDMGLTVGLGTTEDEIQKKIAAADDLFDLVLIAEKMDESLILMKELLCWKYEDVVFFPKNARKSSVKPKLSADAVEKLRLLNRGDQLLYDHFVARHNKEVARYGVEKMAQQVTILNSVKDKLFKDCKVKEKTFSQSSVSIFKEKNAKVGAYVTEDQSNTTCLLLSLPEYSVLDMFRKRRL